MARAATVPKPPEVPVIPDDRTEIISQVTVDPSLVLRHTGWFDAYYAALAADVAEHVPDVTTEGGRDQIKSLAFRIVKARTGVEDQRKRLTENWRKLTDSVNRNGRAVREKFEALEETARKPLTEWQAREDQRKADIDQAIQGLKDAATISFDDTAASVAERLRQVKSINDLSAERFGERQDEAQNWYDKAVADLSAAHARLVKSEAEARELAELREQQARQDRETAAAQMAAAREAQDREVAERAAEAARLKAEAEANERVAAAEREAHAKAQREIDAANRALEEERRQREAERKAQQAEDDARQLREQDEAHRRSVNTAIKEALIAVGVGLDDFTARKVVVALIKGEIPNCRVEY